MLFPKINATFLELPFFWLVAFLLTTWCELFDCQFWSAFISNYIDTFSMVMLVDLLHGIP